MEAIYFTSFDFDDHESKLAHVHHILDKFSFINQEYCDNIVYKHVTSQHLNQYMTTKSRDHCDNVKVFNQGKSNQIREKSWKNQGI